MPTRGPRKSAPLLKDENIPARTDDGKPSGIKERKHLPTSWFVLEGKLLSFIADPSLVLLNRWKLV